MPALFANNASGVLASGINDSATSIVLEAGQGALFPSPSGGDFFYATLVGLTAGVETSWEIVKCTARSTDTLTVVRAQEGTTAAAWGAATKIELRLTALGLAGKVSNPMTTAGDIIVGGADGAPARLAKGTALQVLRMNAGATAQEYADPAGGSVATDAIWDAAGDLAVGSGANTAARLPIGTALQNLRVNSGATGLEWAAAAGGSASITRSAKTGAYTVVAGDNGTIIDCTSGTFTVSLTAAATLGDGFNCWIINSGTGTITVDPNGTEKIDGSTTVALRLGEGVRIVCNGTNFLGFAGRDLKYYAESADSADPGRANASANSFALGQYANASGSSGGCVGRSTSSTGSYSYAFGANASANSTYGIAVGSNSGGTGSYVVTGAGAMALGGSYASGTDSFAAAIGNNTSSYGATGANSVAIGYQAKATGLRSVAITAGTGAIASGNYSFALCVDANSTATASGQGCIAMGDFVTASGSGSYVFGGLGCTSSGEYSTTLGGVYANAVGYGKLAYASGRFSTTGDAQYGLMVLRRSTTDATPTALTSNAGAASTINQVILPNNSCYRVTGKVVAMQKAGDGTNAATYSFAALVRRGANAAATTLKWSTVTTDFEDVAGWDLTLAADTTNGGLGISITGAAATNIRTVCEAKTVEVTYA